MSEQVRVLGDEKACEVQPGLVEIFMLQVRSPDGKGGGWIGHDDEKLAFPSGEEAEAWLKGNAGRLPLAAGFSVHVIKVTVDMREPS
jgi:hypothetical protein